MTHYKDLAPCRYFKDLPAGRLLAVGWLEPKYAYTHGDPGEPFYERLKALFKDVWQPVFVMGGQHCGFCRYDGYFSYNNLFVPGRRGTYVAPEGILHYVAAHDYSPPAEFCDAVMACPPTDSPAYFEALQARGWAPDVARPDSLDPALLARHRNESILTKDGDALVKRIEIYHEATGTWPRSLQDAEALVPRAAAWQYEITDTTYHLSLASNVERNTRRLSWITKIRGWVQG